MFQINIFFLFILFNGFELVLSQPPWGLYQLTVSLPVPIYCTLRKLICGRYSLAVSEEMFENFPLFDETLRHIELCITVASLVKICEIRRNFSNSDGAVLPIVPVPACLSDSAHTG